jgi:ribose 5-phosphate isomerase B
MPEPIAIASDHAGFDLKQLLIEELTRLGFTPLDLGTHDRTSVDYPDFADALAAVLGDGRAERGVLICGTGIGMSIAANRHRHIRAAVCHDTTSARLGRQHNHANVLALGARLIGTEVARDCLATFLATAYEPGRHDRRVAKMS